MGPRQITGAFLGALACYGCWRWLAYLVGQEAPARRAILRYWWPSAMLAWSWFMLWETSFPGSSGWLGFVRDPLAIAFLGVNFPQVAIAFLGVNFPQAVVGNGLLGILIDAPHALQGGVASAAVWLLWYAVIRLWQWRRELSREMPRIVP